MAKLSTHGAALLSAIASAALGLTIRTFIPIAPPPLANGFFVAALLLALAAVLLFVRSRRWIAWPVGPLIGALVLGAAAGPVLVQLFGGPGDRVLAPGGNAPPAEPIGVVEAESTAGLDVTLTSPVDLRVPAIEIRNASGTTLAFTVRRYEMRIADRWFSNQFEAPMELLPGAASRVASAPVRFPTGTAFVDVLLIAEIAYGAPGQPDKILFEINRCRVEIDRSAVNAPVGLMRGCQTLYSEDVAPVAP